MSRDWARESELRFVSRSDDLGEFAERSRDATPLAGIDSEFEWPRRRFCINA